jgi:hypothetical protein
LREEKKQRRKEKWEKRLRETGKGAGAIGIGFLVFTLGLLSGAAL